MFVPSPAANQTNCASHTCQMILRLLKLAGVCKALMYSQNYANWDAMRAVLIPARRQNNHFAISINIYSDFKRHGTTRFERTSDTTIKRRNKRDSEMLVKHKLHTHIPASKSPALSMIEIFFMMLRRRLRQTLVKKRNLAKLLQKCYDKIKRHSPETWFLFVVESPVLIGQR